MKSSDEVLVVIISVHSRISVLSLQKLDQACLDPRHKELVEHLQNSLAILTRTIERATGAAEKLGAVHQVRL